MTHPTQATVAVSEMAAIRRYFAGMDLREHYNRRTGTISYVARLPYVNPNRREA